MEFELLADNMNAVETVAQWYFDEWVSSIPGVAIDRVIEKVAASDRHDGAPLIVLAMEQERVVGAAELKRREMSSYPQFEHWLGGVYVAPTHRGNGTGTALAAEVMNRARAAGIARLYLQTKDLSGGIYSTLNFKPVEQTRYNSVEVLVMVAELSPERVSAAGDGAG